MGKQSETMDSEGHTSLRSKLIEKWKQTSNLFGHFSFNVICVANISSTTSRSKQYQPLVECLP
jgi:hypothetical protein